MNQIETVKTAVATGQIPFTIPKIRKLLGCSHHEARVIRYKIEPMPEQQSCVCGDLYKTNNQYCPECLRNTCRRKYFAEVQRIWQPGVWKKRPDLPFEIDVEHY